MIKPDEIIVSSFLTSRSVVLPEFQDFKENGGVLGHSKSQSLGAKDFNTVSKLSTVGKIWMFEFPLYFFQL